MLLSVLLSVVLLVVSQLLALTLGNLFAGAGLPVSISNVVTAVLYAGLAYFGLRGICQKILKMSMEDVNIPKFKLSPIWVLASFALPALVILLCVGVGGTWSVNPYAAQDVINIASGAIAFFGLAVGFVEEAIFRGVIMSTLQRRWNRKAAIWIPSVLFALLHLIGNDLDFLSIVQLLIAGTLVGVLFSFIVWESGSVWNSALVHGVWNMVMIGGILHIGSTPDSTCVVNFVLGNPSFLLSGGDFGIEASVPAIIGYTVFLLLALFCIRKRGNAVQNP